MLTEGWAAALEASRLSSALRGSLWLYPLVNTGHVVGIALLFGAIVPLDLRLAGCWAGVALGPLARILVPVAVSGLVLALATGALLFATRPLDYVGEPLFLLKMGLVAAALLNALALRCLPGWRAALAAEVGRPWRGGRIAGALSILLWLAVITAGRLIGYR